MHQFLSKAWNNYPTDCEKLHVFDKYHDISAKDHERMRRAGKGSINYNLTINSPLPKRDAIMKSKHKTRQLSQVTSSIDLDPKLY